MSTARNPLLMLPSLALLLLAATWPLAAEAVDLKQAAYVQGSNTYRFGHRSIPSIPVRNAPADTDYERWAMLHDGSVYRLYFFKRGSGNTIYQFGFNRASNAYEFGYQSIPQIQIVGAPHSADTSDFAMLHDGSVYRLYMHDRGNPTVLHQFGFNFSTQRYEYGHQSIPQIHVTGFPHDADHSRWAMLHDGRAYRYYAFRRGSRDALYQGSFDPASQQYRFGFNSIQVMNLEGIPADAITNRAAMLHDGTDYRFYFQGWSQSQPYH